MIILTHKSAVLTPSLKQVLLIESGTTGGGSFESALQHIRGLGQEDFRFHISRLNATKYDQLWENAGVKVHQMQDPLYSLQAPFLGWFSRKLYGIGFYASMLLGYRVLVFTVSILQRNTIRRLASIIRTEQVEIVHLNNQPLRDLYALLACMQCGIRPLVHLRSMRTTKVPNGLGAYFNRNTSMYIANSNASAAHWESLGFDSSKTAIVYNVIERGNEPSNTSSTSEAGITVLGCLANFAQGKGHEFLLQAFRKLIDVSPEYALYLAGKGDKEEQVRDQVKTLKLEKQVHFLGYQEDTASFFNRIQLLLVPSSSEAFGRVILEAWQHRVPVIATRIGGMKELVSEEENGILVEYGNEKDVINAILRLSSQPETYLRLQENGLRSLNDRFSLKSYTTKMLDIYKTINSHK